MLACYKLWHGFLQHLPRLSRFTLGEKIDDLFTDTLELLLLTGYARHEEKRVFMERASIKLDALKFFLRVAWELELLETKKYIAVSKPLAEVGRMLGGWRKELLKRNSAEGGE